jgi:uncharacterized transporter YbjL
MQQTPALIRWLNQTWNSLQAFSTLETILKWAVAIIGIIILLVSWRESVLRKRSQAAEHAKLEEAHQKITEQTEWIQTLQKNSEILESQIKNLPNWLGPSH